MSQSYRILRKEPLTPLTSRFVIEAPWIAQMVQPGQFVIIRVHEKGERIPITVSDYDRKNGTLTLVVQVVGRTSRLLGDLREGETVLDLVGPLGQAFDLQAAQHPKANGTRKTYWLVGGGFGAAAIYPMARELFQAGVPVCNLIGARTKDLLLMERELSEVSRRTWVCTDDGSKGFHGLVTDHMQALLNEGERVDEAVAVGPMPMMEAVAAFTKSRGIATQVSLDPIMVDGTGMCGGCRVTVGGAVKFACVDGPLFDAHQIDFQESRRRGRMYAKEQDLSRAR